MSDIHNLAGKTVLISAGGTKENIDPVRFIGNRSSGKMGMALAQKALALGAKVKLVTTVKDHLDFKHDLLETSLVESSTEMKVALEASFAGADALIMAAAVADYKPREISESKIKKNADKLVIELEKTEDILASLALEKKSSQLMIGFALETDNVMLNAEQKLRNKSLDLIVANGVNAFDGDSSEVTVIASDSIQEAACIPKFMKLGTQEKLKTAELICSLIAKCFSLQLA